MNRIEILLKKAATTLIDGADPFCTDWLVKNSVTLDEVYGLSAIIGHIINAYLSLDKDDKETHVALGILASDEKTPVSIVDNFKGFQKLQNVSKRIKNL